MQEDHEATAALLMLNTDRRSWTERGGNGSGSNNRSPPAEAPLKPGSRSMSVKDLLSG
jgi:hypothetical protein